MTIIIRPDKRGYWGAFESRLEASKILQKLRENPILPDYHDTSWPSIDGQWVMDSRELLIIRKNCTKTKLFLVLRNGIWFVWVEDHFLNADFIR